MSLFLFSSANIQHYFQLCKFLFKIESLHVIRLYALVLSLRLRSKTKLPRGTSSPKYLQLTCYLLQCWVSYWIWTNAHDFADRCLTTWLNWQIKGLTFSHLASIQILPRKPDSEKHLKNKPTLTLTVLRATWVSQKILS